MKPIRRYYNRKQVADILGVKCYEVTSKIATLKDRARADIRRLEKKILKLSPGKKGTKYTDYHLEQLRNEISK